MGLHYFKVEEWLLSKPLALAHVINFLPLADTLELAHGQPASDQVQALGWANFILYNMLTLAH